MNRLSLPSLERGTLQHFRRDRLDIRDTEIESLGTSSPTLVEHGAMSGIV